VVTFFFSLTLLLFSFGVQVEASTKTDKDNENKEYNDREPVHFTKLIGFDLVNNSISSINV